MTLYRAREVNRMELGNYPCLSIREAVHYYDTGVKQIKRDIKSGIIPAVRIMTRKGKRWRIFPNGVPGHIQDAMQQLDLADAEIGLLTSQVALLQEKVVDLTARLEVLSMAQMEALSMTPVPQVEPVREPETTAVMIVELPPPVRPTFMQFLHRFLQPLKSKYMQPSG